MNDDPVRFKVEELKILGGRRLYVYEFELNEAADAMPEPQKPGEGEGPQVSSTP